jgi:hypothetical protein
MPTGLSGVLTDVTLPLCQTGMGSKAEHLTPSRSEEAIRLTNQKRIRKDSSRSRECAFCKRCGALTYAINFDRVPSAYIGLHVKCIGGDQFTKHEYVKLTEAEWRVMTKMPVKERVNWYLFERPGA